MTPWTHPNALSPAERRKLEDAGILPIPMPLPSKEEQLRLANEALLAKTRENREKARIKAELEEMARTLTNRPKA